MPEAPELRELGDRLRPLTLAAEQVLPLAPELVGLMGRAGLRRGSTLAVAGPGATSLALAVLAGPVAAGSWLATVGPADLGLVAGAGLGLALERVVVVDEPEPQRWAQVVATLVEAFEVVLVRTERLARAAETRRIEARARQRGGVLCLVDPDPVTGHREAGDRVPGSPWPATPDVTLTVTGARWWGITADAPGAGHLRVRQVTVEVAGRRQARADHTELWLPGEDGRCRPVIGAGDDPVGDSDGAVGMGSEAGTAPPARGLRSSVAS